MGTPHFHLKLIPLENLQADVPRVKLLTRLQDCLLQRHWWCESCEHLINKLPPLSHSPLGCYKVTVGAVPSRTENQELSGRVIIVHSIWKVTHFPSSDSVIKPKRSGVTIWNYCLWWSGTVKQYHFFAPAKLEGKIAAFFHKRTWVTKGLKNLARFYY